MAPPPPLAPLSPHARHVMNTAASASRESKTQPTTTYRTKRSSKSQRVSASSSTTKTRSSVPQRHERDALVVQAQALEAQLDALRRRAGLPTRQDTAATEAVQARSFDVEEQLHRSNAYLGRLDSMLTKELLLPAVSSLSTYIHLPIAMEQRRAILRAMQTMKLRRGIEVATAWLHHLDPTAMYLDEKGLTIESGEYYYYRVEVHPYPNFQTARQIYNTFVDFRYNMEISVTDGLGQLTLREDADDTDDPTIWNHRFVTITEEIGVPEELNLVCFAQFYSHSPYTNSPMGIVVVDTVNVDDLYPYRPLERTCKDVQSIHMFYEVPKPGTTTNETVVVFKQYHFCVQLPPRFDVAPGVVEQLQRNFPRWPSYIVKYLHDYVVPDAVPAGNR